jgi:hypothetical protein
MKILFSFLVLICFWGSVAAQRTEPQLLLRKNGKVIKRFYRGDDIIITTALQQPLYGYITGIKADSIFLNQIGFSLKEITALQKPQAPKQSMPISAETLALITLGVGLTTAGITLSGWEDFGTSLAYASVLGYGPIVLNKVMKARLFKKKRYRLGNKFALQVLDLRPNNSTY